MKKTTRSRSGKQARVVQVLEDAEVQEDDRDGQGTRNNNQGVNLHVDG